MPMLKIMNAKGKYYNSDARELLARYILNPQKSPSCLYGGMDIENRLDIESRDIVISSVVAQMDEVARYFHKDYGVQLRHFVVSYKPNDTNEPEIVGYIACCVAEWLSERYKTIYAVHENTDNLHFHVMFNSVSYVDGYKYHGDKREYYQLIEQIKSANRLFGISNLRCVSNTSYEDIQ